MDLEFPLVVWEDNMQTYLDNNRDSLQKVQPQVEQSLFAPFVLRQYYPQNQMANGHRKEYRR